MYCKILSAAPEGVDAYPVGVEVDVAQGLPMFNMVGSIGTEVKESRERVSVALKNSGLRLPVARITVNFSPADIRKEGTGFDLAIAVGLLADMNYFEQQKADGILFLGELGLDGEIRRIRGVLPMVRMAVNHGIQTCVLPAGNLREGSVVPGIRVLGAENITEVIDFLKGTKQSLREWNPEKDSDCVWEGQPEEELSRIVGQKEAKRAAQIAAAGFHNLLMVGPPGAGKSMIAKCIPGILPELSLAESLEVTSIKSVAGLLREDEALVKIRPFVNPHHTVTLPAFAGGGVIPRPGMMSLAHRGVLFMDELPEFGRSLIDAMRQPLEDHRINLSRLHGNIRYPADFLLVCAMNPCPCGYYPDRNRCKCSEMSIRRYMGKVSGPILDRIDLCVELQNVGIRELQGTPEKETSREIREKVKMAREIQRERFQGTSYTFNSEIQPKDMDRFCMLDEKGKACMAEVYRRFALSARTYHRVLKCARTIADLEGDEKIREEYLLEAASYRPAQEYWN